MDQPKPLRVIRWVAICLILLATAGCDQTTKHFARSQLSQFGSAALPGGFVEFTLAENPGAFLSLGASLPETTRGALLTFGVAIGLACLLAYVLGAARLRRLSFFALALIWAGGMSNLIDRFARHGLVTDFILLRAGPFHTGIFNVADLAIVFGMGMLLVSIGLQRREGASQDEATDSENPSEIT